MPIQSSINFVKDRLASGLSLTKPALDLLAERLDEAARFNEVRGNPSLEKPKERVSMPALIHGHGRIETAMMCVVVENVASAFLVHNHGVRGAIDRTLPLLSTRAMSTFDTAYDYLLGQAHTLVDAAAKSLDDRISPSLKAPAGAIVAGADRSLRVALGEDYVVGARAYVAAIPERASTFAKVKAVKVMAIKDHSRLASFLFAGVIHSSAFGIFGASSLFAFTHVFTIRVEEQEDAEEEGAESLADTPGILIEDVVGEDKDKEVDEEVKVEECRCMGAGKEEMANEAIAEYVMEADTCVEEDDDEIIIIPSSLTEEGVVEEELPEEVATEVAEQEMEVVDAEATLSVAESLGEVEGSFFEDMTAEEKCLDESVLQEKEKISERPALDMFDEEMLLELAIIGQYQGQVKVEEEEEEDTGLVDKAILCGFEEGLSGHMLLELAIMEHYHQQEDLICEVEEQEVGVDEGLVEVAEAEDAQEEDEIQESLVEELAEGQMEEKMEVMPDDEEHLEEDVLGLEEGKVETLFANNDVTEAKSALDFEDGKQPNVMSGVRIAAAQEEDILWDYYPTEYLEFHNGEYRTMYDELRWAGECMAAYHIGPIKEVVHEDVVPSGPIHQVTRCSSMPCLLSWRSVEEGSVIVPSVSFEFHGRELRSEAVDEMHAAESGVEVHLIEDQEEDCVVREEEAMEEEARLDSSSLTIGVVQETRASGVEEKENMPPILVSGLSTLTPFASAFVPRGNLTLSTTASTSTQRDSDAENAFHFQLPPPAHWTPAQGVSVTISAPCPTAPRIKVNNGPSRRERHLARMGAKKGKWKGKGKGKDESSVLSSHDLNVK